MNVIPSDDILTPCRDRAADGERETTLERHPQQLEYVAALVRVGEVADTRESHGVVRPPGVGVFGTLNA